MSQMHSCPVCGLLDYHESPTTARYFYQCARCGTCFRPGVTVIETQGEPPQVVLMARLAEADAKVTSLSTQLAEAERNLGYAETAAAAHEHQRDLLLAILTQGDS